MSGDFTERDLSVMRALRGLRNSMGSAQQIAAAMGLRPSRKHILPVTKTLRSINRRFPSSPPDPHHDQGKFIARLPPRDQWDSATWCIGTRADYILKA